MKITVLTLQKSAKEIGNAILVVFVFLALWGVVAVQLFGGQLWSCSDTSMTTHLTCVGNFTGPNAAVSTPRQWVNAHQNFDDIGASLLTLFEVMTLEQWVNIAATCMGVQGKGIAPTNTFNPLVAMFFVCFIIMLSFFGMTLLVSVIVDNFLQLSKRFSRGAVMTPEQQQWVTTLRSTLLATPSKMQSRLWIPAKPKDSWEHVVKRVNTNRVWVQKMSQLDRAESMILSLIVVNVLVMAMDWRTYRTDDVAQETFETLGVIFLVIFTFEASIKMYGFGPLIYFNDKSNTFDFLIVMCGWFTQSLTWAQVDSTTVDLTLLRVARLTRLLRLARVIKLSKNLRSIFAAFITSVISMGNVVILLLLAWFMFTIVGMSFFGSVDYSSTEYLNEDANFATFGRAFLLVFRMATGENWNGIMHDCMVVPTAQCALSSLSTGCMQNWAVILYFILFGKRPLVCAFTLVSLPL